MNHIDINNLPNLSKIQKTMQLHPVITQSVWQYARDGGVPLQVAYAEFIVRGINDYLKELK